MFVDTMIPSLPILSQWNLTSYGQWRGYSIDLFGQDRSGLLQVLKNKDTFTEAKVIILIGNTANWTKTREGEHWVVLAIGAWEEKNVVAKKIEIVGSRSKKKIPSEINIQHLEGVIFDSRGDQLSSKLLTFLHKGLTVKNKKNKRSCNWTVIELANQSIFDDSSCGWHALWNFEFLRANMPSIEDLKKPDRLSQPPNMTMEWVQMFNRFLKFEAVINEVDNLSILGPELDFKDVSGLPGTLQKITHTLGIPSSLFR